MTVTIFTYCPLQDPQHDLSDHELCYFESRDDIDLADHHVSYEPERFHIPT